MTVDGVGRRQLTLAHVLVPLRIRLFCVLVGPVLALMQAVRVCLGLQIALGYRVVVDLDCVSTLLSHWVLVRCLVDNLRGLQKFAQVILTGHVATSALHCKPSGLIQILVLAWGQPALQMLMHLFGALVMRVWLFGLIRKEMPLDAKRHYWFHSVTLLAHENAVILGRGIFSIC